MNTPAFNRSSRLFAIIALIALQTLTAYVIPSFCGGSGTSSDPYKICTAQDLADLGNFVNSGYLSSTSTNSTGLYFLLMNDIDLTSYLSSKSYGWEPIGIQDNIPFGGIFNGDGHKITGLWTAGKYSGNVPWITGPSEERSYEMVGLFGSCYDCSISNLGVEINNAKGGVKGSLTVGGLVGATQGINGTISNCYVKGDVSGESNRIGGLVGFNYCGTITSSYATGHVSGGGNVGGLVGGNFSNNNNYNNCIATITNSYATGSVSGEGNGIGGLVGENRATIINSYSTGTVSGKKNVGGLVGWNEVGTISNCYATGNVNGEISSGNSYIGGLVGFHTGSSITNCYASGNVSGFGDVGGLVGINEGSTITNSVAANNSVTSTIDAIGRIAALITYSGTQSNNYANSAMSVNVGSSTATFTDNDVNGTGKSLSDLKSFAFYNTAANWYNNETWDIDNSANPAKIWQINDGTSLPFFQSQTNVQPPPQQVKEDGATVAAPTLASKATNSITIKAVTAPANGQVVEYGINTSNTAPSTWQTGLAFTGIKSNTTYYIFARSKENTGYNAGTPSTSLQVKTNAANNSSGGGGGGGGGGGVTPINPSQTTISNISVRATNNAIVLENLPNNAKVEVYNLQGKRIYSAYPENPKILKIEVQTGMYIVKVGNQTLRAVIK